MKKYLFLSLLIGSNAFAQLTSDKTPAQKDIDQAKICGGIAEIFKIKGTWKKTPSGDNIIFPDKTFPSSQYSQVFTRLEKVLPMLKEAIPDLGGFDPVWYRSINSNSLVANGPVPSRFTSYLYEYYCNDNLKKILLAVETAAKVDICFNDSHWFENKIDTWNIDGDGKMIPVYQMPDTLGKWKGSRVYELKQSAGTTERIVVLGHNREMPWHVLTQKQYLTGYKNHLERKRKEQLDGHNTYIKKARENIANMQTSKALTADQRKSIVEKLEKQLRDFENTTLQKQIAATEKMYNDQVKPVNDYVDTASSETLSQQAVLDVKSNIAFKGYFVRQGNAGIKLITFTSSYFNKALPRYVPQYMVVYWRWSPNPSNLKFAKQFEENFPLEKLQALIDK